MTELKAAFVIAVQLYIPFLVVDLIVASVLLGMGMMMLPPVVVSLPFKLLVFVLMDGWGLLVAGLVMGSHDHRRCRAGQQALWTSLCGGPLLLTALVVGTLVSLLQAVTQIQEMTLVFVPKMLAVFAVAGPSGS